MAVNHKSWGILGNPTREKIAEYQNMPVGQFKQMVKDLSRGKKNRTLSDYTCYVIKKKIDCTRGVITTQAFDSVSALSLARQNVDSVVWDATPYKTGVEELVYTNYDPKQ